jgi:hypothetical protein
MSNKAHNKRRNAGLLYEFLVRTVSQALVEGDQRKSAIALKILRRHFKPGTQLYKEFRLINSLVKTTVSSDAVAASILGEAKAAARAYDMEMLDREKSLLIRHINHSLRDECFYDQPIKEYKEYATVQTLINDWRSPDSERDLARQAMYEDRLVRWLTSEKKENDEPLNEESSGTVRLAMKIMTKRLNEKYAGALNDDQRAIVKSYVFATASSDPTILSKHLIEVRDNLIGKINAYVDVHKDNVETCNKMNEARQQLVSEQCQTIDDDVVTRFMLYARLNDELDSKE